MATLMNRNGVWYARFQHKGKGYLRTTKVEVPPKGVKAIRESREEAEAVLNRVMAEIKGGESVDALFQRLLEGIANLPAAEQQVRRIALADRLRQDVTATLAIEEAWDAWVAHPNRGVAGEATVKMYQAHWGRAGGKSGFMNWLRRKHPHVKKLHEVSGAIAEEYAACLKAKAIAPSTYNGSMKFLAGMFRTLKARAGLIDNVWAGIHRIPSRAEGRRNLTSEELSDVCRAATGDLRYLLALGIYSGLRLGDCVTLEWTVGHHVNGRAVQLGVLLDEGVIRLVPNKTRRSNKVVTIPIHPVLLALLQELRAQDPSATYLFPRLAKLYIAGHADRITNRVQKLFRDCGIETTEKIAGRKRVAVRVGFHSLRHSFVSLCAANKVPQHAIQELVGHGSPAMTMLYSHADDAQKAEAINGLPDMVFSAPAKELKRMPKAG